jgi:hypothetical protein
VARWDVRKLQPLCDVVQQLQQAELTGADLLWTFVSRYIQPFRRWKVPMWLYSGPSCSDHFFSIELDNLKIDTQIRRILTLGAHQNSGPSPVPLREGSHRPLGESARACYHLMVSISAFLNAYHIYMQGLGCVRSDRQGGHVA